MKPLLKLENFKGFAYGEFEFAPMTLLFGANSTGKSTVLQAIRILADHRKLYDSDLRVGASEGQIELKVENTVYSVSIPEELSSRSYLPPENVFHLSAVRYELPRELTEFKDFPTRMGVHGENFYEFLVADTLKSIVEGEKKFTLIEKVNSYLKEIGAGFFFVPKVDLIPTESKLPRVRFSIYVNDKGVEVNLVDAGFGYTQFLYVTTFVLSSGKDLLDEKSPVFVLLEEPGAHLNQKLIVELFDMILKSIEPHKFIIIETHSEHILMRLRRRVAEGKVTPDDTAIYFFKKEKEETVAYRVEIDEYGELSENFPPDFFSQTYEDLRALTEAWRIKDGDNSD